MPAGHADSGFPYQAAVKVIPEVSRHSFPDLTRTVSLRNVGANTVWVRFEKNEHWFQIAVGTAWDDRVVTEHFYCRTQTGVTFLEVVAVGLKTWAGDLCKEARSRSR